MRAGAPGHGKHDVLEELTLLLTRLFARGGNRVGAVLYDTGAARVVPPGRGRRHVLRVAAELERAVAQQGRGTTDLGAMLDAVARVARRRAVGLRWLLRRRLPAAVLVLGLAVLGVGAARPQVSVPVASNATTILLALDVSGSMCSTDVDPNRITAAQLAASDFVHPHANDLRGAGRHRRPMEWLGWRVRRTPQPTLDRRRRAAADRRYHWWRVLPGRERRPTRRRAG